MEIILASNSPRRRELLALLGTKITVKTIDGIDENYPPAMNVEEIAPFLSRKKADAYRKIIGPEQLVITADTIVTLNGQVLGKPKDLDHARQMLATLSGNTHQVTTGVTLTTQQRQVTFHVTTQVTFGKLAVEEINSYVEACRPLDKAGAYGIQEWIGAAAITHINGSFYNVMGLPVQRLYTELKAFGAAPMP